ncbi:oligoendopeptidase F [Geoalkalibacter ferrihydriticus]|uniref:Oligoendopeptidase F n=2 Tax=Geoalkalibacter ferrihydriticus TaxID=392333 RepID=A0A0C2HS81_9BACT|nr:M3 family oligoendopeptidase [Geoalkalibacter ferrihydriticus]KIH77675.1 oligoendopeptidase F [Geoalkalibacter ferrihydriticus DSM 17813]SDL73258.1 oligoendopeptidase F [Geoalkalibacter ferrihydriticus]
MAADSPTWNLAPLYQGADDPALEADLEQLRKAARTLRRDFRGRIASDNLSADVFAAALRNYEQMQRIGLKPYLYAQLLFSADSRPDAHKALFARVRELWSSVSEEVLFFELEMLRIDEERFAALLKDPGVAAYSHYLHQMRAHAPYTLSEEVEKALKRKDLTGKEAFVQLFEELTSSLTYTFTLPGEEQAREVTGEELLALLHHPDGKVREEAFAAFLDKHADNQLVLSSCFNNLFLDHAREVELRKYPDIMTPTHLSSEAEPAMVERMMEVTEANYGLAQEYFRLKQQLLGLDTMKNTDIYAPLDTENRSLAFSDARTLVLDAFAGFAPELAQAAAAFFDEQRIDVAPRPGKTGGAYCMGMMPGFAPYVLLNYTGNLRDVATLAHELGHGVHFALSQEQNLFHYQASLPFAETASVFGEMLLTRHLLNRETDPQVKIGLLCAKLEDIIATTFRQTVLTRFEIAAHRRRAEGLLSPEDYCALWWQENAKLFGDAVTMIEPYRWGWSYISHFIHARFYCFSYVFGELLVLALYQKYLEEGQAFVPKYLELLRQGGSRSPQELLAPLGIDLADPDFWQKGYDFVGGLLKELKTLVAAR